VKPAFLKPGSRPTAVALPSDGQLDLIRFVRGDTGGADDIIAGTDRWRPKLGLSVLLAADGVLAL
jgi:hypothetical protein